MTIALHAVPLAERFAGGLCRFVAFAEAQLIVKSAPPEDQERFLETLSPALPGEEAKGFLESFGRWLAAIVERRRASLALAQAHRRRRNIRRYVDDEARQREVFDPGSSGALGWAYADASL